MSVTLADLGLIGKNTLAAILRDEQLGEATARKINNRKQKSRLRCYIYDRNIPDIPPNVPQASRLPLSSELRPLSSGVSS